MRAVVLGSGAGGGFPQWNCGCDNCRKVRAGVEGFEPRTQSSLSVSVDGRRWAILNASPDIREQINRTPALHPTGLRDSPLSSVLVTNGDIDHLAGLLTLREQQSFALFVTPAIAEIIATNAVFKVLNPEKVTLVPVSLEQPFALLPGLQARLFAVPGKVPLWAESGVVVTDMEGEQTVGVELWGGESRAFYIPGCAKMTRELATRLKGAPLVFFDGTAWADDEMARTGVGEKTSARMGHMTMGGEDGSIAAFRDLEVARRIYLHINNTNPVLDPASPERREAERAGWEIGRDGQEVDW
ncbi:MAG: pyrroloquinoline quinone biosynthesis protein PqqB [Rhodospirillum sp.]|nr:pyrroloquinoline quinone biosynthesis protein PqqB [Rhodospirillum sp.]MCF8488895.1 pyrroloquinoline quinone biosynthesis protein PqqB [Rhodospirillum sp.]MCF8500043.1 pyrroloquinoline quinone biosynthesis protein PqqB [Rhodospirillum sp.]